jgi:hypothetical protein
MNNATRGKIMKITALVLLAAGAATSPAHAEGLRIEPGLWEMTSTINMLLLSDPAVSTVSRCIEKSEITMDEMGGEDLQNECSFEAIMMKGDSMQWIVDCQVGGGSSRGEWVVTSHGDSLTSEGTLTMNVNGQEMAMDMNWSGQRTGPCPDVQ